MLDDLDAHARIPVARNMRCYALRRIRGSKLGVKEGTDVVGHGDQAMDVHVSRSGCVYTTCWFSRAKPTSVKPVSLARRTARAVGADTATSMRTPAVAAFCTIS